MAREFISGLPGNDLRKEKSFEQVTGADARKAIIERRKLDERKRLYSSRQTEHTRRVTNRIVGDRDD